MTTDDGTEEAADGRAGEVANERADATANSRAGETAGGRAGEPGPTVGRRARGASERGSSPGSPAAGGPGGSGVGPSRPIGSGAEHGPDVTPGQVPVRTSPRVRAALAVLTTVVLGGAIVGIGQGGGPGSDGGSGAAATSTAGAPAPGGGSAVQALGAVAVEGRRVYGDEGCGGCHRLADAGTSGRIGPDLDEALTGDDEARIRRSIVDPQAEGTPGFSSSLMPDRYGDQLSPQQLDALVPYLAAATKR